MSEQLLPGYRIYAGSSWERAMLVKFMQLSYQELFPEHDFSHLARTVEQYFSKETPLWWVDFIGEGQGDKRDKGTRGQGETSIQNHATCFNGGKERNVVAPKSKIQNPKYPLPKVACLWAGNAIDQVTGDRHAHIFLLYVQPEHRRRGIGRALMHYVENWARARGDRQLGLQVFQSNTAALHLYNQLGYQTQSLWIVKQLRDEG